MYDEMFDTEFQHVPLIPPRDLHPEQIYAAQWKAAMEAPHHHDDRTPFRDLLSSFTNRYKVVQRHAHLAATFVTWLGTSCGSCYLRSARQLSERPGYHGGQAFVAQWGLENHRVSYVNSGWRTIEYFLYAGDWNDASAMFKAVAIPQIHASDLELLDHVAHWLGERDGLAMIAKCEQLIYARDKGLTDDDLKKLGVNL